MRNMKSVLKLTSQSDLPPPSPLTIMPEGMPRAAMRAFLERRGLFPPLDIPVVVTPHYVFPGPTRRWQRLTPPVSKGAGPRAGGQVVSPSVLAAGKREAELAERLDPLIAAEADSAIHSWTEPRWRDVARLPSLPRPQEALFSALPLEQRQAGSAAREVPMHQGPAPRSPREPLGDVPLRAHSVVGESGWREPTALYGTDRPESAPRETAGFPWWPDGERLGRPGLGVVETGQGEVGVCAARWAARRGRLFRGCLIRTPGVQSAGLRAWDEACLAFG